jgi:hypothetical protein
MLIGPRRLVAGAPSGMMRRRQESNEGPEEAWELHLCLAGKALSSKVSEIQLNFHMVEVSVRASPPSKPIPLRSSIFWNSVHAQIGKLHFVDRD